jgi:hypothetical protein
LRVGVPRTEHVDSEHKLYALCQLDQGHCQALTVSTDKVFFFQELWGPEVPSNAQNLLHKKHIGEVVRRAAAHNKSDQPRAKLPLKAKQEEQWALPGDLPGPRRQRTVQRPIGRAQGEYIPWAPTPEERDCFRILFGCAKQYNASTENS